MLLKRAGVIGGTSAGASAIGKIMPYENKEMEGFGFCDLIVDQHFDTRDRTKRLKKIVDNNPGHVGVGIDEGTALVIEDNDMVVIGKGGVRWMK